MYAMQDEGCLKSCNISHCGLRLGRVVKILKTLVQQFDILETMDAQAFHDFREFHNFDSFQHVPLV